MIDSFLEYLRLERNRSVLTAEAYGRDLRLFTTFLGDSGRCGPEEAGAMDVRAWLAAEAASGNTPRTLRRKTQSLRSFYRWMNITGRRSDNPAARITLAKPDKPLPTFVESEEMEGVIESRLSCDPYLDIRNRLIVEMLYGCGLRQAELLSIRDSDISLDRAELRVHGKGGKTRIIPLAETQTKAIAEWQRLRDGMTRFPAAAPGERPLIPGRGGKPLSSARLYTIIKEALDATSTHRRSPHTLRHSFATAMLNGGADIVTVKEFLGHSSLESTQIYTHLNFRQLQSSYRAAHPRAKGRNGSEEGLSDPGRDVGEEESDSGK